MNAITESLADPHMRHAIMVHLPIVAAMLAPILLIALAVSKFKNRTIRFTAVSLLVLGSLGAALAANAGEAAEDSLGRLVSPWPAGSEAALEKHEELAENGWIWPLIPAALLLLGAAPSKTAWRAALGSAALVGSVGVAGWMGLTAHAGGDLVYRYGLGAPSPALTAPAGAVSPAPGRAERDDD